MFRFQYGRWFSWDVGVQVYFQSFYKGAGGCLLFNANGYVGTEGVKAGTWQNPGIYLEVCLGGCYRYRMWGP